MDNFRKGALRGMERIGELKIASNKIDRIEDLTVTEEVRKLTLLGNHILEVPPPEAIRDIRVKHVSDYGNCCCCCCSYCACCHCCYCFVVVVAASTAAVVVAVAAVFAEVSVVDDDGAASASVAGIFVVLLLQLLLLLLLLLLLFSRANVTPLFPNSFTRSR